MILNTFNLLSIPHRVYTCQGICRQRFQSACEMRHFDAFLAGAIQSTARYRGDVYKLSWFLGHNSVVVTENYLKDFYNRNARQGQSKHSPVADMALVNLRKAFVKRLLISLVISWRDV